MEPPHEVRDAAKVVRMVEILERGGKLPPVVAQGEIAFSGSHRLAAWDAAGMRPETVEITDAEYCAAMVRLGKDPLCDDIADHDDFIAALRAEGVDLDDAE